MSVRTSEWRAAHMATQRSFWMPSLNLRMHPQPQVDAPASEPKAPPVRSCLWTIGLKHDLAVLRAELRETEPHSELWQELKSEIDMTEQHMDDWENERARALAK